MPRPHIIRADTMDLQSREAASAQDHQNLHLQGGLGTSQSNAIKNVAAEQAQARHDLANSMNGPASGSIDDSLLHNNGSGKDEVEDEELSESAEADDGFDEKMSSSPSIDDEDIDFDFVYALHTFVATVDGQANAAKGDTMVLLDDSNSYWWLVRIVKDSSIGYLPAEHIETPSERLARLNKHRNVDLSSSMLHDSPEKPKNPIKKAIRRRNAKAVSFAPPQYFDYEYDTEEDEDAENGYLTNEEDDKEDQDADEITAAEPTETTSRVIIKPTPIESVKIGISEQDDRELRIKKNSGGTLKDVESALLNGDVTETKKITLTPKLIQDGSSSISTNSISPALNGKDKLKTSLDSNRSQRREDLVVSPPLNGKGDKKSKKSGGVLGGFFKKRSKNKGKHTDEVDDLLNGGDKQSSESLRETLRESHEEARASEPRKLEARQEASKPRLRPALRQTQEPSQPSTIRKVESESPVQDQSTISNSAQVRSPIENSPKTVVRQEDRSVGKVSSESDRSVKFSTNIVTNGNGHIDNSGYSTQNETDIEDAFSPVEPPSRADHMLSESPEQITHEDATEPPPALVPDNSSEDIAMNVSPIESSETVDSRFDSAASATPIWSDSSLKTYFDDDNDVRDFLVVLQDNSDTITRENHPAITSLFQNDVSKLQDLTSRLDSLLGDWLERKART